MSPDDLLISARYVFLELTKRGVEAEIICVNPGMFRYKHPRLGWQYMIGVVSQHDRATSLIIADNKIYSMKIAEMLDVPHPKTWIIRDDNNVHDVSGCGEYVVKPIDGAHGNGVTIGVSSPSELQNAVNYARKFSDAPLLVQEQVHGEDYRLLYIDGEFVAGLRRDPAGVVGDGESTVAELIVRENETNELRGEKYVKPLNKISIELASAYLGFKIEHVPKAGDFFRVMGVANHSLGGAITDTTSKMPQSMIDEGKKIVHELKCGVAGLDFMWNREDNKYYFIELNSSPAMSIHDNCNLKSLAQAGPGPVTKRYVDFLLR